MFKEKYLKVCSLTGFTEIEIQFLFWNNAPRTIKESYTSKYDADKRIKNLKIDYLLFHLEQYVSECNNLMETGISYSTAGKKIAFETCIKGLHYFQDKPLHTIANYLLKMEPMLLQLLPGEKTQQYEALYKIYIRIITFCQSEQTTEPKKELPCLEQ